MPQPTLSNDPGRVDVRIAAVLTALVDAAELVLGAVVGIAIATAVAGLTGPRWSNALEGNPRRIKELREPREMVVVDRAGTSPVNEPPGHALVSQALCVDGAGAVDQMANDRLCVCTPGRVQQILIQGPGWKGQIVPMQRGYWRRIENAVIRAVGGGRHGLEAEIETDRYWFEGAGLPLKVEAER